MDWAPLPIFSLSEVPNGSTTPSCGDLASTPAAKPPIPRRNRCLHRCRTLFRWELHSGRCSLIKPPPHVLPWSMQLVEHISTDAVHRSTAADSKNHRGATPPRRAAYMVSPRPQEPARWTHRSSQVTEGKTLPWLCHKWARRSHATATGQSAVTTQGAPGACRAGQANLGCGLGQLRQHTQLFPTGHRCRPQVCDHWSRGPNVACYCSSKFSISRFVYSDEYSKISFKS
jgi:hypothetical protein